jgi:hypothetical protein
MDLNELWKPFEIDEDVALVFAEDRGDGFREVALQNRATGEVRAQIVKNEAIAKVQPKTIIRRFQRRGFNESTPHTLIG